MNKRLTFLIAKKKDLFLHNVKSIISLRVQSWGILQRKNVFGYYLQLQGSKLNQGQIPSLPRNLIFLGSLSNPTPRKSSLKMQNYTHGTPPSQKYHITENEKRGEGEGKQSVQPI